MTVQDQTTQQSIVLTDTAAHSSRNSFSTTGFRGLRAASRSARLPTA